VPITNDIEPGNICVADAILLNFLNRSERIAIIVRGLLAE